MSDAEYRSDFYEQQAVERERERCAELCRDYIAWSRTMPDCDAKSGAVNAAQIILNAICSPGLPVTPRPNRAPKV